MTRDLYVAPWLGEFGWEVCMWVPWLRSTIEEFYRASKVVVMCKPGHRALYANFVEEVREVIVPGLKRIDCENCWIEGVLLREPDYRDLVEANLERHFKIRAGSVISPPNLEKKWGNGAPRPRRSRYVRYGTDGVERKFLAVHARELSRCKDRNWSREKWNELCADLCGHVVAIGHKEEAFCPPECEDLRGLPLSEVLDALSRSKAIIGPSSGPLPLANLCGTSAVWWSPNSKDIERFEWAWNPFKVPNHRVKATWDPSPEQVLASLAKVL